ncbi:hypothetical protein [Microbulbifer sp. VAAF005]|nr:hypothetical protein [Microbulbifer sp. VAAF005]WHI47602.1 hypothetical protein P0078_04220 [Microbulbifer sp. VAAF005]
MIDKFKPIVIFANFFEKFWCGIDKKNTRQGIAGDEAYDKD